MKVVTWRAGFWLMPGLLWACSLAVGVHAIAAGDFSAQDTAKIEALTGVKGELHAVEQVFKVSQPRSDLAVTVGGVKMTPPMGLTSWAAFKRAGGHTMLMGDIVLLEDQVNRVMDAALESGLDVTALHNHFLWDQPKVMFMHIGGMGDAEKLAGAVGRVLARVRETAGGRGSVPRADINSANTALDTAGIERIVGAKGTLGQGVFKIVVGRKTSMMGHAAGKAMGVNTWAAFAGTDKEAAVDGDFAVREEELQDVLKALRGARIEVVAIHNHMTFESPRLIFLHYWGIGPARDLAAGVRAALDKTRDGPRGEQAPAGETRSR